jgi:starvation-inducible outer membrane lipoprotein
MLRVFFAASLAALLAGCASIPQPKQSPPQVNRAVKADKKAAPKPPVNVEKPTPNETVKKRWYDRFLRQKPA